MTYYTKLIFGKDQIKKYHNNETFTDSERIINLKKYSFETQEERNAFYKGIDESIGWLEVEVINESEDKINREKKDENSFNYWVFIEKYYPNYCSCDNVLLSNILTKKLNGYEICEKDEEYIKDWNIKKELFKLDKKLLCEAFRNYFDILYPEKES